MSIPWLAILLALGAGAARAEHLVDRAQLESWADDYYGRAVAEKRSPGITVSVVQDGEVILAKGYGYADYGRQVPVDPERSGFVIGSVTKTFIATAVAQLIDRGAIGSFDDPVNRYLERLQLPGARGARVTIRHLLNHQAGFEDGGFGYLDPRGQSLPIPLSSREIERYMPQLVLEPGGPAIYSNWGFSVLGFLIEDVTGKRVDDYLRENIWRPLGMSHTTLYYGPVPANLSVVYVFDKGGNPIEKPLNAPHPWIAPAGTVVSTAGDMARYMNAHILQGDDGSHALMSKVMFRQLHTETVRNAPISNGFAHTFWTATLNGASTIEHGGGAPGFQTMMVMIPEKRFGFFVSAMQGGLASWEGRAAGKRASGAVAVGDPPTGFELRESFIDRFLKRPPPPARGRPVDPARLAGTYWTLKRPFTTVEVLGQAFDPAAVLQIDVTRDGQGVLLNGAGPYKQLGGGVFESPTGDNVWTDPYRVDLFLPPHLSFNVDDDDQPVSLVVGLADQLWVRASAIFNPSTMLLGFAVSGFVVLTGILLPAWPQRRRFANPTNYLAVCLVLGVLAIPYAIVGGFDRGDSLVDQMALGDKTRLWAMVVVANAMVLLVVTFVVRVLMEWTRKTRDGLPGWAHWGRRMHLAGVALSSIALLIVFGFFNLLGIHLPG